LRDGGAFDDDAGARRLIANAPVSILIRFDQQIRHAYRRPSAPREIFKIDAR
jgi:hypothetical protein